MSHVTSKINNLSMLTETFDIDDFTDGTDDTGYADFTNAIPANAIPLGWKAVVSTGFTGDTTAVVQVGSSSDVDMLSGAVPSCLAAGTVGSSAPDDTAFDSIGTALTPRVTVAGQGDFGNITAGEMTITIFYLEF